MKQIISIGAVLVIVTAITFSYLQREAVPSQVVSVLSPTSATTTPPVPDTRANITRPPAPVPASAPTAVATFKVGDKKYSVEIPPGGTVMGAMRALASTSDFIFTSRIYPGLGEFVDSIGGVKNAGGMYWILYVNDVSATSGASIVTLVAGDAVEWKYEKNY